MSCCFAKKNNFHKIHPEKDFDKPINKPLNKSLDKSSDKPISILKNKKKRIKRNSIYPQVNNIRRSLIKDNKDNLIEKSRQRDAFTKKFLSEIIPCGACEEKFTLGDHAIQINCGSCNKFYHCSIAGACVGPNCSIVLDGKKESLKYCMSCVNPYLKINIMDNGLALCKLCENDPLTDKEYLKV